MLRPRRILQSRIATRVLSFFAHRRSGCGAKWARITGRYPSPSPLHLPAGSPRSFFNHSVRVCVCVDLDKRLNLIFWKRASPLLQRFFLRGPINFYLPIYLFTFFFSWRSLEGFHRTHRIFDFEIPTRDKGNINFLSILFWNKYSRKSEST